MTRNEKLFNRLDELVLEYKICLIREFEKISKGYSSRYFNRKADLFKFGPKAQGKVWLNKETALIEKIEKEIVLLNEKLNHPSSLELIEMANEFIEKIDRKKDRFDGGGRALARQYVERISTCA